MYREIVMFLIFLSDLTFKQIFKSCFKKIFWTCILCSVQTSATPFTLKPEPTELKEMRRGTSNLRFAVYDVPQFVAGGRILALEAKYSGPVVYSPVTPPVIHAHRFQTGEDLWPLIRAVPRGKTTLPVVIYSAVSSLSKTLLEK